jgi:hypothetical protein
MIYEYSVRTTQKTRYIWDTRVARLVLFMERVAVYCENYMKHLNAAFYHVKVGGTYSNHWVLKG